MFRKWAIRAAIAFGAVLGAFLILAFTLQVPAVGRTIGAPQMCGTCHVMSYEVVTLERSAHRDLTCLDCHAPSGFFEKPVAELKSTSKHLYVFLTNSTPDVIKPEHSSREITQGRCVECHSAIAGGTSIAHKDTSRFCFECHRETPHGTPLRN